MSQALNAVVIRSHPWVEPLHVVAGLGGGDGVLALLSDGGPGGRWSHVGAEPDRVSVGSINEAAPFEVLRDPAFGPGTVGLAAYDAGARLSLIHI